MNDIRLCKLDAIERPSRNDLFAKWLDWPEKWPTGFDIRRKIGVSRRVSGLIG